jgi:hypothetical protein
LPSFEFLFITFNCLIVVLDSPITMEALAIFSQIRVLFFLSFEGYDAEHLQRSFEDAVVEYKSEAH